MAKNCNMALQEGLHAFERSKLINSFNKYDKGKQQSDKIILWPKIVTWPYKKSSDTWF